MAAPSREASVPVTSVAGIPTAIPTNSRPTVPDVTPESAPGTVDADGFLVGPDLPRDMGGVMQTGPCRVCPEPSTEVLRNVPLCAEHAAEARKIMVKTVFGIGPTEMFAAPTKEREQE
jgi:hypothetical protein